MKIGYSLLLGEYLQAESISYDDCNPFQIVCPVCKEPVFKVVRDLNASSSQYLSHYNKDKSYDNECELRVTSIPRESIEKTNSFSRGQRLEYFLKVLQQAILEEFYPDESEQSRAEQFANKLRRSKGLKEYREFLLSHARKIYPSLTYEEIQEALDGYTDDITEVSGEFPPTEFSLMIQKRIAHDIWLHLLSPKARDNYLFVFSHAYIALLVRLELARNERGAFDFEICLNDSMVKLADAHIKEGRRILSNLAGWQIGPPYAIEGSNLFSKMSAEIEHEMLGILLHLPYFELLQKANSSQFLP